MNDDFSELWQSQPTFGATISLQEVRRRFERSKARTRRMNTIAGVTAAGNLLLMVIDDVFFFESPFSVWFKAAEIISWVIWGRYLGKSVIPTPSRILTLNLGARSTPCLTFYRQHLETERNSLRQGRGFTLGAGVVGMCLIALSSALPVGKHPGVFLVLGIVLAVGGFAWYVLLMREYPRIQSELDDLDAFAAANSVAKR